MTKEQFEELQLQQSDLNLKTYLKQIGVNYSTYNYWRKKLQSEEEEREKSLAPISFKQSSPPPQFSDQVPGVTLLLPNGLRAHFGSGTESMLNNLLDKSLTSHVLPQ